MVENDLSINDITLHKFHCFFLYETDLSLRQEVHLRQQVQVLPPGARCRAPQKCDRKFEGTGQSTTAGGQAEGAADAYQLAW